MSQKVYEIYHFHKTFYILAVSNTNISLNIMHTPKMKRRNHHHGPRDLRNVARNRVEIRAPDVSGKTSPPWNYGIIHSKLIISDR